MPSIVMPKESHDTAHERLSADYKRLKADYDRLLGEVTILRGIVEEHARTLQVQFKRIAEMQAILDEEHRHDGAIPPNPVIHQTANTRTG
jgi:hypothetical protein